MAWSYRRRIKLIPGVHLNFSKSGISTSIGTEGASFTFGKHGTYINAGIPALGIYNRYKINKKGRHNTDTTPAQNSQHLPLPVYTPVNNLADNIFSADPQKITSQDMEGVKEAILAAHAQRLTLTNDLSQTHSALAKSKRKLILSYAFLYGLFNKSVSGKIKDDITNQKQAVTQIQEQIENSAIELNFKFDDDLIKDYNAVATAFKNLCTCDKVWDVTSAYNQDRVATRSAASSIVTKKEVRLEVRDILDIRTNFSPLYFQNGNGADLYFYPNFLIVYISKNEFAIVGFNELEFTFNSTRFVEEGVIPRDSKIIDRTWLKVNKNGTPDKRFKGNYEIPIVLYGNIALKTRTGLHEQYEFSSYELAEKFANAFLNYQNRIEGLQYI